MALGVTFPKNEDVVAFERKNEMLVLLVSKLGTYKKELGNYAGYWLRKMYRKDLHCRGMQISRNALTHVWQDVVFFLFGLWNLTKKIKFSSAVLSFAANPSHTDKTYDGTNGKCCPGSQSIPREKLNVSG